MSNQENNNTLESGLDETRNFFNMPIFDEVLKMFNEVGADSVKVHPGISEKEAQDQNRIFEERFGVGLPAGYLLLLQKANGIKMFDKVVFDVHGIMEKQTKAVGDNGKLRYIFIGSDITVHFAYDLLSGKYAVLGTRENETIAESESLAELIINIFDLAQYLSF